EVGRPLRFAESVALIEVVGRTAPGIATITGGRDRLVIDFVERKIVIHEVGIEVVVKTEAAITGLAIRTNPVADRAAEELSPIVLETGYQLRRVGRMRSDALDLTSVEVVIEWREDRKDLRVRAGVQHPRIE